MSPSPFVSRVVDTLGCSRDQPVLDAGCGAGRNSIFLLERGFSVVGVDIDRQVLTNAMRAAEARAVNFRYLTLECDLNDERTAFAAGHFGSVLLVHFLPRRLEALLRCLQPGGYLLIETEGNHGGNYVELPRQGALQATLAQDFNLEVYQETAAGPKGSGAAKVRLLARKH